MGRGTNINTIKWLAKGVPNVMYYMFPAIVAGIIVAIFFASGQAAWISAVAVCALIAYSIMLSSQIRDLKDQIKELATSKDLQHEVEILEGASENTDSTIEALNEKVNFVAQTVSAQIDALANSMTDEYREVYLMLAEHRFGPADEDGEAGV